MLTVKSLYLSVCLFESVYVGGCTGFVLLISLVVTLILYAQKICLLLLCVGCVAICVVVLSMCIALTGLTYSFHLHIIVYLAHT